MLLLEQKGNLIVPVSFTAIDAWKGVLALPLIAYRCTAEATTFNVWIVAINLSRSQYRSSSCVLNRQGQN
jgi:hypothetical protein